MSTRNRLTPLGKTLWVLILVKVMVLTGIWYVFIRDNKVPHGIPETTRHLLKDI